MHFLRALDHSMFCIGGIGKWASHNTVPRLGASDVRYTVPEKRKFPFDVPADVPLLRSCHYNKDTKKAKYDVAFKPVISCFTLNFDEGPKDLPTYWYLPSKGYRCLMFNNPFHRTSRDMQSAAQVAVFLAHGAGHHCSFEL